MAKKKSKSKGFSANDITIAQAVADEKYGPQVSEIQGLYGQAGQQLASDITAAKGQAKSAALYSDAARPEVASLYAGAKTDVGTDNADVLKAFGTIGAAADAFRAATAREYGATKDRIVGERTGALQSLTDRKTAAQSGQQYAITKARADYGDTTKTLGQKLVDVAGLKGSAIAAQLGTLANQRADRSTKIRTAQIQAHAGDSNRNDSGPFAGMTDAEIGALSPAERQARVDAYAKSGGKGKSNRATSHDQNALNSQFGKALAYARQFAAPGKAHASRGAAAASLLQGAPATKTDKALPAIDQLPLSLALDMAYDGHISRANTAKLHKLGYKVDDLGNVVSAGAYAKQQEAKKGAAAAAAAAAKKRAAAAAREAEKHNVFHTTPFGGPGGAFR